MNTHAEIQTVKNATVQPSDVSYIIERCDFCVSYDDGKCDEQPAVLRGKISILSKFVVIDGRMITTGDKPTIQGCLFLTHMAYGRECKHEFCLNDATLGAVAEVDGLVVLTAMNRTNHEYFLHTDVPVTGALHL